MEATLEAVQKLGPAVRAAADEIAATRRIPEPLLADNRSAGAIRMPMPAAWGGPELDPLAQVRVIAELASHDPSTGWIAMICCDGGYYAGFLGDDATARELYPDIDLLTSGQVAPVGRAEIVDGGHRVSGRWSFGSGILHADRIVGGALVYRDGELVFDGGLPRFRVFFLPTEQVEVHDTWHTTGLAGTSSNDYSTTDAFVPEGHDFSPFSRGYREEPLYAYHGLFFAKLVGIGLGALGRAIEEFRTLAETKCPAPTFKPIKNEYRVQVAVAEAQADLDAMWGLVDSTLGGLWDTLTAGQAPSLEQRAAVGAMGVWVAQTAKRAVDALCAEAGTDSIFATSALERLRRDVTTMTHHLAAQRKTYQVVGQLQLGVEPAFPIF